MQFAGVIPAKPFRQKCFSHGPGTLEHFSIVHVEVPGCRECERPFQNQREHTFSLGQDCEDSEIDYNFIDILLQSRVTSQYLFIHVSPRATTPCMLSLRVMD